MPSDMAFRSHFGSWGNALKAAGFQPIKVLPRRPKGARNKSRKKVDDNGYLMIFEPSHPCANVKGYVREHRMIAYDAGLLTDLSMQVHHINEDKKDNRLENLQVISISEHISLHHKGIHKNKIKNKCNFKDCNSLQSSKYNFCNKHYKLQWQRLQNKIIGNIYQNSELLKG